VFYQQNASRVRGLFIRNYNLCFLGYGNVNRTLVHLLRGRERELRSRYGITFQVTGIASRRIGWIANPAGLSHELCEHPEEPSDDSHQRPINSSDVRAWLREARAEVLFEATSLNVENGQPAIEHLRAALENGAHGITANKGPVVHAYAELRELAEKAGRRFLFESSVMDGVPIFSLFRESLPLIELRSFRGILNSTTNVILTEMESGSSFDAALSRAQAIGVAETEPSYDIDGWDAAVKVAALTTVLMSTPTTPDRVRRQGIRELSADLLRSAKNSGKRYKLVCRARRVGEFVETTVQPEALPATDPLAQVDGTSSIICFETDIFPELVITEHNPGLGATAYGMLSDFVRAAEGDQQRGE
jgi:homoserine dehydrogenase